MAAGPKTTQADPTQPRPVDATGRTLDQWDLPVSGPARLKALGGKPDPALAEAAPDAPPVATTDKD
ncbi:hypothetical protein [Sphingomonas sp. Leaf257]|jgi:hypothetical protein|uniref:hypothetical protein n=1 Tax=Sphingomonas sp. Leaf257 TaxID=1736309 RepID=UPI0006F87F34|nr:hypothetical protein [Sphingomonas sp. Leaf257]KQO58845.1 hypothetical protein ASF14_02750 [Sphingomonas sp. Leaf257]